MHRKLSVLLLIVMLLSATGSAVAAAPCTFGAAYDPTCDVNQDGNINVLDIQLTAGHWAQTGTWTGGGDGWLLTGNAATVPTTNFVGTSDGQPLVIQPAAGYVGIGTTTPQSKFNVVGTSWFQGDSTPLPAAAGKGVAIGFGGEVGYIYGFDYASFTPRNLLLQSPGGNVGIGNSSPTGGKLHVTGTSGTAVYGTSSGGIGVSGNSSTNSGVYGYSSSGYGADGRSSSLIGVYGQSYATASAGVYGLSAYIGTQGIVNGSDANRQAIRGDNNGSATGYAGLFYGNTWTIGTLYKNAGAFRIDHPLDPANKYLNHSFVESPDMKNIYDGVATLDSAGAAVVTLPDWFEALNENFRYQLTAIGAPGPNLYIAQEIKDNQFSIAGGTPGMKVSWQVTGIRHDPYAEANRIPVEQDKTPDEQGKYIYPAGYGEAPDNVVPALKGIDGSGAVQPSATPSGPN